MRILSRVCRKVEIKSDGLEYGQPEEKLAFRLEIPDSASYKIRGIFRGECLCGCFSRFLGTVRE